MPDAPAFPWRRISADPTLCLGREADNRSGELRDRTAHAAWFDFLEPSAPNHALKTLEARRYLGRIEERLASDAGGRPCTLLDVGGGTGRLALPLARAGHRITLVEPSPEALADASRALERVGADGVELAWGNAYDLGGLPAASHDAALALELLCYLEEPERALAQIASRVRAGGHVFLSVEAWPVGLCVVPALDWREIAEVAERRVLHRPDDLFVRYFDAGAVAALAASAGLVVEALEATHHVLEGIFASAVDPAELDDAERAEVVLGLERDLAADPATAPLGRAWFATLRKP